MSVTREDVVRIAELARIQLTAEEVDQFLDQLNGILAHADELKDLDTAAIREFPGMAEGSAPRRSEELGPDLLHLPLAEFAQGWQDGFFTVPRLEALDSAELEDLAEAEVAGGVE